MRRWLKLAVIAALVGVPSVAAASYVVNDAACCCGEDCDCGKCDCPGCKK